MTREPLTSAVVSSALEQLPGWTLEDDGKALTRNFVFKDFSEAFGFMSRAALLAEKIDHHPEWFNVYRKVNVRLTTHSAKGLTDLDLEMARFMNAIAGS